MFELWRKCKPIERLLIAAAAAIFGSALFLLITFESFFLRESIHPDDVIGEVLESSSETRRRSPVGFEFRSIKKGDIIGNGDTIYSGDDSKIRVKFLKGSQLVIGQQSLVVLREIDGKLDMKIDKGAVSGMLGEAEEIAVKTEEESITINGEEEAQFSISYKPGMGMEVTSFDRQIKVGYKGEQVELKDKKAFVSKKKGIEVKDGKEPNSGGRDTASTTPEDPPKLPPGMKLDDLINKKEKQLSLGAPFPLIGHVFLHTNGGQIPIYPKEQCVDGCELEISVNGAKGVVKQFARNTLPLLYIKIDPNIDADVSWKFRDGSEKRSGQFFIKINNEDNFGKALLNKSPIEVVN